MFTHMYVPILKELFSSLDPTEINDWLIDWSIYVQDKLDGKFNINFIWKYLTPYSTKAL